VITERIRAAGSFAWAIVGLAAMVAVAVLVLWQVRVIFPPLILAGAIVFLLNPIVTRLQRNRIPRAAGAAIAYLAVAGIIGLASAVIVPLASDQVDQLSDEWADIEDDTKRWIDDRAADSEDWIIKLPTYAEIEDEFSNDDQTLGERIKQVREFGARVFHVLLIVVLAPIIAFYLLVDLPHTKRVLESLVPAGSRVEVEALARRLNRAMGGFFRGQLAVAAIVGVLCSIGLAIIGLKFWFLIGMIAGLFNLIPLIGPWIGGIPGVAIALTTGSPLQALGVVLIMVGVQQVDNHFITPFVMQRAVRLHPAAVILALVAGGTLGGFFGLLLAVPVAAALKILASHLWRVHVLGEAVDLAEPETGGVQTAAD
jgi:predicted PurR-regulated permease PerM